MATERKPQRNLDRYWMYPSIEDVLKEVGLKPITHYVEVMRQTIACFIVHRPIFDFCLEAERLRGTSLRQWWWEQQMDLELEEARGVADAALEVGSDDGNDVSGDDVEWSE